MKRNFRITITNHTDREMNVLPLQRRILPHTSEILEHSFSRPLSIRMAKGEDFELIPFEAMVKTIHNYDIIFKKRKRQLEWKIAVKNDNDSKPQSEGDTEIICTIASEDETKNVPPGGDDD